MGVGGQRHAPAALPSGNTRYPLYRRLVGPQGRSGRLRKISPLQGFDPRTVHPVASRYTDCAIPAHGYRRGTESYICISTGHPCSRATFVCLCISWSEVLCRCLMQYGSLKSSPQRTEAAVRCLSAQCGFATCQSNALACQ